MDGRKEGKRERGRRKECEGWQMKEGRMEGRKEERREGEGRKVKDGRKEGRLLLAPSW